MQKQGLFFIFSIFLLLAALFLSTYQTNDNSAPATLTEGSVPGNPDSIDWQTASQWILDGKVKQIVQTHALNVTMDLKSGEKWQTVEPKIDDIFKVIETCGAYCEDIIMMTE